MTWGAPIDVRALRLSRCRWLSFLVFPCFSVSGSGLCSFSFFLFFIVSDFSVLGFWNLTNPRDPRLLTPVVFVRGVPGISVPRIISSTGNPPQTERCRARLLASARATPLLSSAFPSFTFFLLVSLSDVCLILASALCGLMPEKQSGYCSQ